MGNARQRGRTMAGKRIAVAALAAIALWAGADAHAAGAQAQGFASPEAAVEALAAAWRADSKNALLGIFGSDGERLVSSGDLVAEHEARARMATEYEAQHRIEVQGDRRAVLVIGKDEFPYPIPLVRQADAWHFDAAAGEEEILNRRIGRNELHAIAICRAYVEAQREYAQQGQGGGPQVYALRLASSAGRHDGLYWPAAAGQEESPLGPLVAKATAEGYHEGDADTLEPYHGYHFRILTRQGADAPGGAMDYVVDGRMTRGFALVAFPARWGDSGVMTFVINHNGIVFEKNLGPDTQKIASQMTEFNPDRSWQTPH